MSETEWEPGDALYERPTEVSWRHDFFSIKHDAADDFTAEASWPEPKLRDRLYREPL